jgi:hypothetical protein
MIFAARGTYLCCMKITINVLLLLFFAQPITKAHPEKPLKPIKMKHQIKTEIVINAPKETVWEILSNFEKYEDWNPFIIKSKGKAVEGNTIENTIRNGNKDFTFKPKLLNVRKNEYLDWLGSLFFKGLFDGNHYFEIKEIGPGQVLFIHGENFSGILSSYILKKIGEDTRNNFIKMNEALKKAAEEK